MGVCICIIKVLNFFVNQGKYVITFFSITTFLKISYFLSPKFYISSRTLIQAL